MQRLEQILRSETHKQARGLNALVITDGCDTDGRVSSIIATELLEDYGYTVEVLYLDRDRTILPEPKWEISDSKGEEHITEDFARTLERRHDCIIMTDICLDKAIMDTLNGDEDTGKLTCFDHHRLSDELLEQPYMIHSLEVSASKLIWDYFYEGLHKKR